MCTTVMEEVQVGKVLCTGNVRSTTFEGVDRVRAFPQAWLSHRKVILTQKINRVVVAALIAHRVFTAGKAPGCGLRTDCLHR